MYLDCCAWCLSLFLLPLELPLQEAHTGIALIQLSTLGT